VSRVTPAVSSSVDGGDGLSDDVLGGHRSSSTSPRRRSCRAGEHQAFRNLDRALRAGGSGLVLVCKVTVYVTNVADHFETMATVRPRGAR